MLCTIWRKSVRITPHLHAPTCVKISPDYVQSRYWTRIYDCELLFQSEKKGNLYCRWKSEKNYYIFYGKLSYSIHKYCCDLFYLGNGLIAGKKTVTGNWQTVVSTLNTFTVHWVHIWRLRRRNKIKGTSERWKNDITKCCSSVKLKDIFLLSVLNDTFLRNLSHNVEQFHHIHHTNPWIIHLGRIPTVIRATKNRPLSLFLCLTYLPHSIQRN